MIKKCVVCGSDFESRFNLMKKQICCSKQCSKMYQKEKKKEYTEINREHLNEMQRMRCKVHCKICGERIIHHEPIHKPRMHEQCIINSCLDTKRKGEKLTKLQYTRLYAIGYTVADINEMLSEECLK